MSKYAVLLSLCLAALTLLGCSHGLLYPKESESREVKEINGIWHFRADYSPSRNQGFVEEWYKEPLQDVRTVVWPSKEARRCQFGCSV